MSILLQGGADINYRSTTGQTPLMKAVGSRSLDAVKLLLDQQCDHTLQTPSGISAYSIAGLVGNEEILELLRSKVVAN